MKTQSRFLIVSRFLLALTGIIALQGCLSNGAKTSGKILNTNGAGVIPNGPSNTPFTILDGSIGLITSGTPNQFEVTLITGIQPVPLGNFCTISGQTSTCNCVYRWTDAVLGARGETQPFTTISSNTLRCNVPNAFSPRNGNAVAEIANGTTITMQVVSNSGTVLARGTYLKGSVSRSGDGQDQFGNNLFNVSRYTCYEKFKRPVTLSSAIGSSADQSNNTVYFPYANSFCYRTMSGQGGGNDSNCSAGQIGLDEFSVQSFYYNLYTDKTYAIHADNSRYHCPKVKHYGADGVSGEITSPTTGNGARHWPLDSNFALASSYSGTFPVGVSAPSLLGSQVATIDADLTKSEACVGQSVPEVNSQTAEQSILYKCIGYAARPDSATGACLPIQVKDINGVPQPTMTHRLRRFYAVYPPTFDVNGAVFKQPNAVDVIYVRDRCVSGTGNICRTAIAGPKPCTFAWYDTKAVVSATKKYYGINSTSWSGKNVDGIHFPNKDTTNSCSTLFPLVNRGATFADDKIHFATSHETRAASENFNQGTVSLQTVYVRPTEPWAPYYVEDTDFQACAPDSFNPLDSPIYVANNDSNSGLQGYCAAVYPTDTWNGLTPVNNLLFADRVPNTATYDKSRMRYRKIEIANPLGFDDPPLQAPVGDIKSLLNKNPSYSCMKTVEYRVGDGTYGPPLGTSSPAQGCCAANSGLTLGAGTDAAFLIGNLGQSTSYPAGACANPTN